MFRPQSVPWVTAQSSTSGFVYSRFRGSPCLGLTLRLPVCACMHVCVCARVRVCVCVCVCMRVGLSLSLPPHPHLSLGVATRDVQVCNQPAKCTCCSWRELLTGLQSLRITLDAASSTTPNSASKTERRSKALWSSLYAPVGFCGRGNRTQDSSVMERTGQQIV